MTIEQIIVIAVVQGITEFLPISSSGHLILIPALTGWPDQGQFTDVMVHLGTLGAILVYFWRDVLALLEVGGNIYYLAKLAGIFHLGVQDIGAQQTGMSVEAFKAKLVNAGK